MKWHPSSLGKLMTNSRTKSEKLSQTTKSYIRSIAKQDFYGYNIDLNNKFIIKGREQEQDSIKLLNSARFTSYEKNDVRIVNEWLTGEADIVTDDLIIDIKTSWSLETFPATPEEADDSSYEWQLRAYMMLYDKPRAELTFCMVSTDPELLNEYENLSLHQVNHIDPTKRVTTVSYVRDLEIEEQIKVRLQDCTEYYNEYIEQLNSK
jgi:hypothetical protein